MSVRLPKVLRDVGVSVTRPSKQFSKLRKAQQPAAVIAPDRKEDFARGWARNADSVLSKTGFQRPGRRQSQKSRTSQTRLVKDSE